MSSKSMSSLALAEFTVVLASALFCAPIANAAAVSHSSIKHNIREIVTYDAEAMEKMVNRAINSHETDDNAFYSDAADVLATIVLVHPRFAEREAGLSRLKSKMDQEEFYEVMRRAATKLQVTLKDAEASPSDQASALVALTNWVVEARHLPEDQVQPTLEVIAKSDFQISDAARDFGREPLEHLISPSEEAKAALAKN